MRFVWIFVKKYPAINYVQYHVGTNTMSQDNNNSDTTKNIFSPWIIENKINKLIKS